MPVMYGVAGHPQADSLGARVRVQILNTYDRGPPLYEALRAGAGSSY